MNTNGATSGGWREARRNRGNSGIRKLRSDDPQAPRTVRRQIVHEPHIILLSRLGKKLFFWFLAGLAWTSPLSVHAAGRPVALVIGNSSYVDAPLRNPANDAQDLGQALKNLGFEVQIRTNLTGPEMKRAIQDFGSRLQREKGLGLFFFAGHGLQIKGKNYLIPVGRRFDRDIDVELEAVEAYWVVAHLEAAQNGVNIVILDACRNNPIARSARDRTVGLARMDAPRGTLVAYATAPGQIAADGDGRNGLYTKHLLKHLGTPGVPIEQVFKRVRLGVESESKGEQNPREDTALTGEVVLVPGPSSAGAVRAGGGKPESLPAATPDPVASVDSRAMPAPPIRHKDGFRDCAECPEMVRLPAGSFTMGSPLGEEGRDGGEGSPRNVVISKPFAIGRFEITRRQFARFAVETGHSGLGCINWNGRGWVSHPQLSWRDPDFTQDDEHPIVCVSWDDVRTYLQWLSQKTHKNYRLPTEAEWEYAARAGTRTSRPWGENPGNACRYANALDTSGLAGLSGAAGWPHHACDDGVANTASVGRYPANAFGLFDMIGNVAEWVEDCWRANAVGASPSADSCRTRTLRGGGWSSGPAAARSAARFSAAASTRSDHIGFRVVRNLEQ